MSFFDDASLVMIPSGYKDQKVYSVKPIDGSGDLTFSRASSATRVNSSGLVEKVRENLALQSNDFSNASWTKTGATVTGGQSGYDGTNNAWLLTKSAPSGRVSQTLSTLSSASNTLSIYVKANASTWCAIEYDTSYRYLNLSTGAVSSGGGGYSVQSIGNGWYRLSINNSSSSGVFRIYPAEADDIASSSGSIFIQAAQVETGDIPTDYIATTSSAVSVGPVSGLPRLDYSGGASCPSLLLEPQRTNAITFSEDINNAFSAKVGVTITSNNSTSPDGYVNADLLKFDATNGYILRGQAVAAATTYTMSVFVKNNNFTSGQNLTFNMSDGVVGGLTAQINVVAKTATYSGAAGAFTNISGKVKDYGNGWFRVSVTGTSVNGGSGWYELAAAGITNSCYIWGFSLEIGAYATSYINTLSTAVTRVADAASKTGISSLIGQTEGTIFVEFQTLQLNPTSVSRIILSDGTTSNYMFLGLNEAGSGNLSRLYVNNTGAGTSVSVFSSTALTVGTNKLAMAYKSGSFALYLNGNLVGSSSSAVTIPATSELVVGGQSPSAITQLETMVDKQIILFKTRLSNADLATLTA